jgi:hypothetical protein
MLDDPLQSLDDVNLLGLVDTLRRTKALRQHRFDTRPPIHKSAATQAPPGRRRWSHTDLQLLRLDRTWSAS